jgi:predicted PurR-regulated permease PerM
LTSASDRAWRLLVVAAAIGVVVWTIGRLSIVIVPVMLGAFIASLWSPMVQRLRAKRVPSLVATWVAVILGVGSVVGIGWAIGSAIASRADELSSSIVSGWNDILEWLETGPLGLSPTLVSDMTDAIGDQLGANADNLVSGAIGGASMLTEVLTGVFFTSVAAFFILKDGDRFWQWLLSRVRADRRRTVDEAGRVAWVTMRRYLGGTAAVGVVDGALIGLALVILDVPLALPLSVLVFFGAFFPFVGALVSGLLAALVTLATNGPGDAAIIVIVVTAIQQVEGDVLAPVLLGRAVALHPFVVIVALAVGVVTAGLVGAFLAVPIVGVAVQIVRHISPAVLEIDPDVRKPGEPTMPDATE